MHRSGTSLVSKALSDQGIDMGDMMMSVYEDKDFLRLNQTLLSDINGCWNRPPKAVDIPISEKRSRSVIKSLIANKKSQMWGWKDPRTSLTLPAYLPHLSGDVYLFCCFRKPSKVAMSLHKRDNMNLDKARDLAMEYNERIFDNVRLFLDEDLRSA